MQNGINILTVKDLARILKIGKNKAYALMHSNSFPSMRLGRTYVVTEANLAKWLTDNAGKVFPV